MSVASWLTDRLFERGPLARALQRRVDLAVKVLDDKYWHDLTTPNYLARPWHEHRDLLEQIRDACDVNPMAARIVTMTTDFVIGDGATITGDPWALQFCTHPQNQITSRLYRWSDELCRAGELFIVLSRNAIDGMSYIREVPAYLIDQVETDPDDVELTIRYHQLTDDAEGRYWTDGHIAAPEADQVMLHYTINRPIGDVRGASDLTQVVKWLERYDIWLEDRVRINRYKGAYLWTVKIDGALPGEIEAKRAQYSKPPTSGSVIVTDGRETWDAVNPAIDAGDVEADGKAIRLMIAAGAGIPLHFLAEGESATRATAREMGTATYRRFAHRQTILAEVVRDVVTVAAQRAARPEPTIKVEFESVLAERPTEKAEQEPAP